VKKHACEKTPVWKTHSSANQDKLDFEKQTNLPRPYSNSGLPWRSFAVMENLPIRQLARTCFMLGLVLTPSFSPVLQLAAQEEEPQPRVASRSPLQFGKNYWPSRPAATTSSKAAGSGAPQPGIFRGGLVQQLRSITSSVLGDESSEETGENLDGETGNAPVPSPPSLKDVIDAPAYTDDMESFDGESFDNEEFDNSIPDAPEMEMTSPPPSTRKPTTPVTRPKMPEPVAPGQSRWRNQAQTPTPLNSSAGLGASSVPRTTPRSTTATPRSSAPIPTVPSLPPVPKVNNSTVDNSTANNGNTGRRTIPNGGKVPTPPSSLSAPAAKSNAPIANNDGAKPSAITPQPSKTNSSRRVNNSPEKLNSNEVTLPTAQVTELDENRLKLSDRAPVGSSPDSNSAEAVPMVSKKLPPGRPKQSSEGVTLTPNALPLLTSTPNAASSAPGSTTTAAPTTTPPDLSLNADTGNSASVSSNKGLTLAKPDIKTSGSDVGANSEGTATSNPNKSLDMEIPSVLVRLAGPSDIPVGRKGDYELIVKNTGSIPLNGAIVRMDVPKGVTSEIDAALKAQTESETLEDGSLAIIWQVAELAAGQTQKLPIKLTASEARNFAIAMEWTVMPQNGELLVNVQKPDLQIGLEGPAEVSFGVPQMYRLKISNPGTAPAENVVLNLSAEPYGSNSSPLGTIAPGTNRIVEVELTFQQKGKLKIKAEAVGENLKSASEIDVIVRQAMLEAAVQGTESEYVGAIVNYTLDLSNKGDTPSENVIAQVELPDGVKLAQLPNGARLSGKILLWEVNSLDAGQNLTLTWQAELLSAGEKLFQATCRGSAGGSAVAQTKTLVEAVADLKLTLSDPPSPSPVGEEVVYELEITNRGKQAANKVKVLAQFSEGIEPAGAVGAEHKLVPGQVLFEPIPSISAGETVKLQVRALASEAGVHRFRIEVQTDDDEIHHVLEESTRYMQTAARPTGTKLR
jgi:hypothetical protein